MRHFRKISPVTLMLVLPLLLLGMLPARAELEEQRDECVILLHGMWRSAMAMKPLQWYLEGLGYTVVNESYPSLSYSIVDLAEMAAGGGLEQCRQRRFDRIHFVTHSLGGILVRQYARGGNIEGLERVVMLGPPNQGSQVADYYGSFELLDPVRPQVMDDLRTGEDSFMGRLGPVNFDLGVIAGTANRRPGVPGFPDEIGDGTVSVAETIVPGMLDFLTMPTTHTFMIWNSDVMEQVAYFLKRGQFNRGD
jgi:triacylglycerol lipase